MTAFIFVPFSRFATRWIVYRRLRERLQFATAPVGRQAMSYVLHTAWAGSGGMTKRRYDQKEYYAAINPSSSEADYPE
jgi:hypothetical protein